MEFDYDEVAPDYDTHRTGGGCCIEPVVRLARTWGVRRALEIGPGTGNNTAPFLDACCRTLIGLERSAGMLEQAKSKGIPARWIRGDAMHIPLADHSVDFVFGCYVLHYLPRLKELFSECARVIGRGGAVFVTAPVDFIERHPMNRYFPSFAVVDKARFQPIENVKDAMASAGFHPVGVERTAAPPEPIDHAYVQKVAAKFVSTYALIPETEFEEGLAQLRADVAARGRLDVDFVWEVATIWGRL